MTFEQQLQALLGTHTISEVDEGTYLVKKPFHTCEEGTEIGGEDLKQHLHENPIVRTARCHTCGTARWINFQDGATIDGYLCGCNRCLHCREHCPLCDRCIRCLNQYGQRLTAAGICEQCSVEAEEDEGQEYV